MKKPKIRKGWLFKDAHTPHPNKEISAIEFFKTRTDLGVNEPVIIFIGECGENQKQLMERIKSLCSIVG